MYKLHIDENGMLKIPDNYLNLLNLNPRDTVSVEEIGDRIIIRKSLPFCRICKSTNVIKGFELCEKCVVKTERMLRG